MNAKRIRTAALCAVEVMVAGIASAQFTGDNQTNIISGVVNNWTGDYVVGDVYAFDHLRIENEGKLLVSNGFGILGSSNTASNNSALVTGTGSVWTSAYTMVVGAYGSGNQLTITNGGAVNSSGLTLGWETGSSSNRVVVTGSGSVYTNTSELRVGNYGTANQLTISDGGLAYVDLYNTFIGYDQQSSNNTVLVTGSNSVLKIWGLWVGLYGSGNELTITNGGAVYCHNLAYVGTWNGSNTVLVTGPKSVLSISTDYLYVGYADLFSSGGANRLTVNNGGAVYTPEGYLGYSNMVLVADNGSVLSVSNGLYIGRNGMGNSLIISNAGTVMVCSNLVVGFDANSTNNLIALDGGNLIVTNGLGLGTLDLRRGTFAFDSGTVAVDKLIATNGATSVFAFSNGTLQTRGTTVTNGQTFLVGNGSSPALFHLLGGVHSFANGIRVRNAAQLTGCGTINGSVLVDAGGTVVADCGGSLTFTGILTNNGTMRAVNGSVLEAYGAIVNNGLIDIIGGTTNFHSTFINNGSIVTSASPAFQIIGIAKEGTNIRVTWTTSTGKTNELQAASGGGYRTNNFAAIFAVTNSVGVTNNYLDVGAAADFSSRFYRVRLVP